MFYRLNSLAKTLCATLLLALPLSAAAVDYDVLGGTFSMQDPSGAVLPGMPIAIPGMGTETPVPGFFEVGKFSDNSFPADFSCYDYAAPTVNADACNNASSAFKTPGGPHTSASRTGLGTFLFFGATVFSHFAEEGVDANPNPHPVPTINLGTMRADFGSFYAIWSTSEFNQGSIDAGNPSKVWDDPDDAPDAGRTIADPFSTDGVITDNNDGSYKVTWTSLINGAPFEAFVGTWTMDICLSPCQLLEVAIAPTLEATQGGVTARTLLTAAAGGAGGATITFDGNFDPTNITYDWSATDDALDLGATPTTATLTIAQGVIDAAGAGIYRVILVVTDDLGNGDPNDDIRATGELLVNVTAVTPAGSLADTDNDGIVDTADTITDVTQLQTDNTTEAAYIMTTSVGALKLGTTAFCADPTSATITGADIAALGGVACIATTNSVDETGTVITGIGDDYYDFEVHNLTKGESIDVIIPLKQPLPVNAGYRKYRGSRGWGTFDQTAGDTVMSAAGTQGACPSAASGEYVDGLVEGYNCMKLTIADGGLNDNALGADGIIKDPGAISSNPDVESGLLDLGGALSWPVLAVLATWIGLVRRKARH